MSYTRRIVDPDSVPHYIYRYYDACGQVLYVGITRSLHGRDAAHRKNSPWYWLAYRIEYEVFPDRYHGLLAETVAIERYQPLHNIKQNQRMEPLSQEGLALADAVSRGVEDLAELKAAVHARIEAEEAKAEKARVYWTRAHRRQKEAQYRSEWLRAKEEGHRARSGIGTSRSLAG
jgi:hypothetical protein